MSLAELAARSGLHRVGARPPFWSYLKQTWERRDFIATMAQSRLRASVEENRLGVAWLVLQPVMNAAIYGIIFGVIQGDKRPPDFAAHVVIGVFLWGFFSHSLTDGAKSITGNQSLVQSLAFPRMTLPLAVVIEQFLALLPSMGLLVIALPFMGHPPAWEWLLMIPLLALYTLFNAGVAMIAARLTVHVRDLTQVLPYLTRIMFYTSGVLFNVSAVLEGHEWALRLYDFYPIYQVLQLARGILMDTPVADQMYWAYFSVSAVVTLVFGLVFFWVAEERYGRD
ncbi:MAG: ABC transporter permease [Propionicimonas sp.]|nr:ABC transporter permease [Propionicimonas sp.]